MSSKYQDQVTWPSLRTALLILVANAKSQQRGLSSADEAEEMGEQIALIEEIIGPALPPTIT